MFRFFFEKIGIYDKIREVKYILKYKTPKEFDDIVLVSDVECLVGLYFEHSKGVELATKDAAKKSGVFDEVILWLDIYFAGKIPNFTPKYRLENATGFRKLVLKKLLKIPYGKTMTYGEIAKEIAYEKGLSKMSAQAVGGAVGWNSICLIIPCHRVIGSSGQLVGYGGGIKNKEELLKLEKRSVL